MSNLVESLNSSFEDILAIIRAIGNKSRFRILISLITGDKTFDTLKNETQLKKTALSNHLTILMKKSLIQKPSVGVYKISQDGKLLIQTLETTYRKTELREKDLQRRQFSDSFVDSFFGKT